MGGHHAGGVNWRGSGDDAIEIFRIALCFHLRLAATGRTTTEIRTHRRPIVERFHDLFRRDCRDVRCPVCEVDLALQVVISETAVSYISAMPQIGCTDRIVARQSSFALVHKEGAAETM